LRDRARAEDVVQEAFVNVWHRSATYRESAGAPMTWLTAIVRNRALDTLRSESRHGADSLTDDEDAMLDIEDERPGPMALLTQAADALAIRADDRRLAAPVPRARVLPRPLALGDGGAPVPDRQRQGGWSRPREDPPPGARSELRPRRPLDRLAAEYVFGTMSGRAAALRPVARPPSTADAAATA
jgi:RNA polymerase sigma factor (sigma-70 family)